MSEDISLPKWSRELQRFLPVKPQFIFWGNIYDVYPIETNNTITTLKLIDYIPHILAEDGYDAILHYEPLIGLSKLQGDDQVIEEITGGIGQVFTPRTLTDTISKAVSSKKHSSVFILNFSSRLPEVVKCEIEEFYYLMFRLCQMAEPKLTPGSLYPKYNLVIWLIDKENDIPDWYTVDNPKAHLISIPRPDNIARKTVIKALSKGIAGFSDMDSEQREQYISVFVDQTDALHATEIVSIVSLAKRQKLPFYEITQAIKQYKLGIIENPWTKLNQEKISNAYNILKKRVKGQDKAIQISIDIIKRSIFNLSGSQYSKYSSRPKGVLFFAGPTGVGKTELAKSLTELIFGSETSYIRFDMTEFRHDHADQRLIGSPPGYVGYDGGGQLTNAVKQNPFSVILFDEIEKAHPRILDLFMQIIDDGRLTSGRGETVYLSECLIIFTSNLGMYEEQNGKEIQRVDASMDYKSVEERMISSIQQFFKFKISRPEILNRIGENIIVFDFIRPDVAEEIFDKMVFGVLDAIFETHKITISIPDEVKTKLFLYCCTDLSMGGRGIGNKMEEVMINPLSRGLYDIQAESGSRYSIDEIIETPLGWKINLINE